MHSNKHMFALYRTLCESCIHSCSCLHRSASLIWIQVASESKVDKTTARSLQRCEPPARFNRRLAQAESRWDQPRWQKLAKWWINHEKSAFNDETLGKYGGIESSAGLRKGPIPGQHPFFSQGSCGQDLQPGPVISQHNWVDWGPQIVFPENLKDYHHFQAKCAITMDAIQAIMFGENNLRL